MRNDVATRSMPDFKEPEFLGVLSLLEGKHIDLATAYVTTLTALTLGMKCEFVRSSGGDPLIRIPADKTFPLPVLYKVTSGEATDHFQGSISVTKLNPNMGPATNKIVFMASWPTVITPSGVTIFFLFGYTSFFGLIYFFFIKRKGIKPGPQFALYGSRLMAFGY